MSRIDNCHSHQSHGCGDHDDNFKSDRSSREETVKFGDATFNVNDEDGRAALEDAFFDADIDAEYNSDSNEVTIGRKTYNLGTVTGREAFRQDARDGEIDGKARNKDSRPMNLDGDTYDLRTDPGRNEFETLIEDELGATYDQRENKVTVERDNGRERTYNLDTDKGRRDFKKDFSDGELDGHYDREAAKELKAEKREARQAEDSRGCDEPVKSDRSDKSDHSDGARRPASTSHLRDVEFNGVSYNLKKPGEEERFRQALMKDPNVTYFAADNMVMVGDKTYDLDDPEGFHAFRQDMADGALDGVPNGVSPDDDDIAQDADRHRHNYRG